MWFDSLRQDIAFAWRSCRRKPGFALTALATLTLGIGANTATFSVVNAVLLKPVPYPVPDRIVMVGTNTAASAPKLAGWRQQTDVFTQLSAYRGGVVNVTAGREPERGLAVQVPYVQADVTFFTLFGATVAQGRGFTVDDDRPNAGHVVLLGYRFWQRYFDSDPAIVGRRILLDNEPHTVIGVMSDRFDPEGIAGVAYWGTPDVWVPLQLDAHSLHQGNDMLAAARLAPGVTLDMARARLHRVAEDFRRTFPGVLLPNVEFGVELMRDVITREVRTSLWLLAGAVGFVLLIACANVASLLLARATARDREIAIRAAIGAGRARIVRQLLTESLLLALASGVCGLIAGAIGVRALLAMNPGNIPRIGPLDATHASHALALDWRVFVFTAVVSLATGVIFGVLPALQASRVDLNSVMKRGGGSGSSGAAADVRRRMTRSAIVMTEVAFAVTLLIGAALLIRSFIALRAVDPGFDRQNVLTLRMSSKEPRFAGSASMARLIAEGRRRIGALPGVEAVGATYSVPTQAYLMMRFTISGRPAPGPYHAIGNWGPVSPGYFEVFKIPLRRGRLFTDRDASGSPPVVIISESLARQFFPNDDPIGRQLVLGKGLGAPFDTEPVRQIVGVVGDVHDSELSRTPAPTTYIPQAQVSEGLMAWIARATFTTWVVRTRVEPHTLTRSIEQALQQVTDGVPVSHVRSMDDVISQSTARATFNTAVLTIFGGAALMLATIGIYGLMAGAVQQRIHEIGVRIALGAGSGSVRRMIIWQGMRVAIPGIALGLIASYSLARVLSGFLFGVGARDPLVFVAIPALLTLVALISVWLPARTACRVDPIVALRPE
jgi:putative ABC transport system permease protein